MTDGQSEALAANQSTMPVAPAITSLLEDHRSLAEAFHGLLGRVLMAEARLDAVERALRNNTQPAR